jgi:hypothetical protein
LPIFCLAMAAVITAASGSPTGGGTSSHDLYAMSGTIGQASGGLWWLLNSSIDFH